MITGIDNNQTIQSNAARSNSADYHYNKDLYEQTHFYNMKPSKPPMMTGSLAISGF